MSLAVLRNLPSAGVFPERAPADSSCDTASAEMSNTTTSWSFLRRLRAMCAPMFPRPMKPTDEDVAAAAAAAAENARREVKESILFRAQDRRPRLMRIWRRNLNAKRDAGGRT